MTDRVVGAATGALIGFYYGGPWGAAAGAVVGAVAGPPVMDALTPDMMDSNNGPKFKADTVQTTTYGAPIPRIYGRVATQGNIIWLEKNKLKVVTVYNEPEDAGGGS